MTDNIVRREVQRRDDPFGIPACFYWTIDEVADWVESIGYSKYKENFRSHFINGRKLLTVDACVLPKMGITHFGDILDLAGYIRDLVGKGPKATWMPTLTAPKFFGDPQKFEVEASTGNDIDYNWRYWVPEFYYGYMPKQYPVTVGDFKARWYNGQHAYKLMGRHYFDLHRPA
ncbi:hypothetical protein Bpfe_018292 [Biomphalaria pfeifferi]|uniref:SAM domain-containing protein n=1 Tax=Biomphalaria pfeifferi TaxID=112525 RepID=A0AAD8BE71_BIOPF|nr:hypothetical protein Bpfe_018292 [Biomphalaria pfeifferi]